MWLALKLRRNRNDRQWGVRLDRWVDLSDALLYLDDLKANRTHTKGADDGLQIRIGSVATTNTAPPVTNGLKDVPQEENTGPGNFMPIRVYGNGDMGGDEEAHPMQVLHPIHAVEPQV